jgi:hypothetical protein
MTRSDRGSALLLALIAAGLLAALGAGLVMLGSTEGAIAANFRASGETFHAADAAAERAMQDLLVAGHWTDVLSGALPSTFVDSTLTPTLASNQSIDLSALTVVIQQQSDAGASWGANNPRWRLFAYGPLAAVDGTGAVQSAAYLVTWIADDPAETDGDPFTDVNGRITLLARAFGLNNSARVIEITLFRSAPGRAGARILSWRERR